MRLIDADRLKSEGLRFSKGIKFGSTLCVPWKEVRKNIDEAPTVDAVEVVRCKYCKHFTEGMAIGMCKRNPDKPIIPVPYRHFCSYGERRDENAVDCRSRRTHHRSGAAT